MKECLLWVWQFPQHIVALLLLAWSSVTGKIFCKGKYDKIATYLYLIGFPGGLTLGNYVFMDAKLIGKAKIEQHEFGHVRQSRILGPFYLLAIGIPSLIHAALYSDNENPDHYYDFYTERWANKLGGV